MLQKMRDGAQGLGAKIIVGIICFVLVVFGFGAFNFFAGNEPRAASVNDDEITVRELEIETQRQKRNLLSRMGDEVDPKLIDNLVGQQAVLDSLINRTLLRQTAEELALVGLAESFRKELVDNPSFQVDGVFNPSIYRSTLQNLGYSPQSFQSAMETDAQLSQLVEIYQDTAFTTGRELRDAASMLNQTRDVAYMIIDGAMFEDRVGVSETEIVDFYEMHTDQFVTEESFDLAYVEFSDHDRRNEIDISIEDVRSAYESAKAASKSNDRRRASHILLEVNENRSLVVALEEMSDIRSRVLSGEDFSTLAKELSEDPGSGGAGGDLGVAGRGAFVSDFEDVLWSLTTGDVSLPFQTEFGVHLVKLVEIETVEFPSFDAEQSAMRETLLTDRAERLFEERLAAVDKLAFEETDSLQPIADTHALEIKTVKGLTRSEGVGVFSNIKVRQGVLEIDVIDNGFNSRPILIEDTHAVVARLVDRTASKQRPLNEVREQVIAQLKHDKADEQVLTAIRDTVVRLENEESASDVAARMGATWVRSDDATRAVDNVPTPILQQAFELAAPGERSRSVGETQLEDGNRAIVLVTNANLGDFGATTEFERLQLSDQLTDFFGQRDFEGLMQTLRSDASIETGVTVAAN
ncbi:MAG: SurA N-terminal domain-containing protein [Pseudomonadales bacterium]|nr:SurA N-terminal domain-containing protein [Pseudomonadales bacterium]